MNYQHIAPVYSYAAADKRPEAGFVIPDFGYNRAFYCPEQQQMHPAPFAQYPQYYPQYYPQVNYPLVVAHHQYSDFKLANVVYPKRPRSIQLPLPRKKPKIVPPKKPSPLKIITKALSIDTDYAPQSSCTSPNLVLVNIVQIVPTTPNEYSFPSNDSNVGLMVIGKNECEIKPEVFKPLEVYNNTEFTKFIQASKELEIFDRSSVLYSENVASKRRKVDKEKIERVPYCAADCAAVIPDIDPTPRTFDEPVIAPECETYPDFYNEEIAAMDKAFKMYGRNFSKVTEAVHVCGVMLKMRGVDVVVKNCKDVIWFHYKNKFRYGWHHVEVSRRSSRKRC